MKLSIIVAMASNRTIGIHNSLPWHLSADLKRFKQLTMGCPILMGRKTYDSIGRPLPGRINIIISNTQTMTDKECLVFREIPSALAYCQSYNEVFVIGGASIYSTLLPQADFIYLTAIHKSYDGDTFFPDLSLQTWQEIERIDINDDPAVDFNYSFIKLAKT